MTHLALLNEIASRVEDAITREDWVDAKLGLREIARMLVDATIAGAPELIARVDETLAQLFTELSIDDSFVSGLTVTALGWSVDGLRDVSQLARFRRPPMTSEQRSVVLRDTEARIIALLDEGNRGPRSNRDIAEHLDLNVATVARTLAELRKAKRVKSWPEGRFMMNELSINSNDSLPLPARNAQSLRVSGQEAGTGAVEQKSNIRSNDVKHFSLRKEFLTVVDLDVRRDVGRRISPRQVNEGFFRSDSDSQKRVTRVGLLDLDTVATSKTKRSPDSAQIDNTFNKYLSNPLSSLSEISSKFLRK